MMRTTLTIDSDVAAMLEERRQRSGMSLKRTINDALRRGLLPERRSRDSGMRVNTKSVDHGRILLGNLDDVGSVLDVLEEPRA